MVIKGDLIQELKNSLEDGISTLFSEEETRYLIRQIEFDIRAKGPVEKEAPK